MVKWFSSRNKDTLKGIFPCKYLFYWIELFIVSFTILVEGDFASSCNDTTQAINLISRSLHGASVGFEQSNMQNC